MCTLGIVGPQPGFAATGTIDNIETVAKVS